MSHSIKADPIVQGFNRLSGLEKRLEKVVASLKVEKDAHAMTIDDIETDKGYSFFKDAIEKAEITHIKRVKEADEAYHNTVAYYEREIEKLKDKYTNSVPKSKRYRSLVAEKDSLEHETTTLRRQLGEASIMQQKMMADKMKKEAEQRLAAEKAAEEKKKAEDLENFNRERAMIKAQEEQRARQRVEEAKKQYAAAVPPPPKSAAVVNEIMSSSNRFLSMSVEEYGDIGEQMRSRPDDYNERDIDDYGAAWDIKFCALEMKEKAAMEEKVQGWNKKYEAMTFDALVAIDPSNMSEKEAGVISKVMMAKERDAKNRAAIASVGAAPKIKMMPKQISRVAPVY